MLLTCQSLLRRMKNLQVAAGKREINGFTIVWRFVWSNGFPFSTVERREKTKNR
jgi:hypothetical protein